MNLHEYVKTNQVKVGNYLKTDGYLVWESEDGENWKLLTEPKAKGLYIVSDGHSWMEGFPVNPYYDSWHKNKAAAVVQRLKKLLS